MKMLPRTDNNTFYLTCLVLVSRKRDLGRFESLISKSGLKSKPPQPCEHFNKTIMKIGLG